MSSHLPRRYTDVNVVPMIDILLVLIIVFMLRVLMVIKVQVPPPDGGLAPGPADDIVLQIDATGGFSVNATPVPRERLGLHLMDLFADRPRKALFVQPDRSLQYRDVIWAMDVARGAGVEVLGFLSNRP